MRKVKYYFTFLFFIVLFSSNVHAYTYDFSAVAPSGQTLYYIFDNGDVYVTYPSDDEDQPYRRYAIPAGKLVIPSKVT